MYCMIQLNIRGCICHVSVRYARGNNKLMGSQYNPTIHTSYIMFVDANNFNGWAMSQPLPDDKYEWIKNNCREAFAALLESAFLDWLYDQEKHYIFEVDLNYSPELHDRDDNYFFAPKTMNIESRNHG